MISRTELLTSSIALIEWLTSSAGTSSTVHRLAALLLGGERPPKVDSAYDHEQPTAGRAYVLPDSPPQFLPDDWSDRVRATGALKLPALTDRDLTVRAMVDAVREFGQSDDGREHFGNPDQQALLDLPPERFRALGNDFLGLAAQWLAAETDAPVLSRPGGAELTQLLAGPPPEEGMDGAALLAELRDKVLRHSRRNGHPRQFAHVCASPDPVGALADLLVSTINQNVTAWRSAPAAAGCSRGSFRGRSCSSAAALSRGTSSSFCSSAWKRRSRSPTSSTLSRSPRW